MATRSRVGARGQGGASEELHISRVIRTIRDREYNAVVEVMNAGHVDWAARNLPARRTLQRSAKLWTRVLTHADLLSKEALRRQVERASMADGRPEAEGGRRLPVVALNLRDCEGVKVKLLRPVMQMLLGAARVVDDTHTHYRTLVCGLPNAGKSSLIYPLTRARAMEVKKKKEYHLPSINKTPGWTLGTKSHIFELDGARLSLTDSPGLRPRLDELSEDDLVYWLATQGVKPLKGMLAPSEPSSKERMDKVVDVLWRALRRHAEISSLPFEFDSPEDLLSHSKHPRGHFHEFIQSCSEGTYGGMVLEDETTPIMFGGEHKSTLMIKPRSTIVAMNEEATMLKNVGMGKTEPGAVSDALLFSPVRVHTARDKRKDRSDTNKMTATRDLKRRNNYSGSKRRPGGQAEISWNLL